MNKRSRERRAGHKREKRKRKRKGRGREELEGGAVPTTSTKKEYKEIHQRAKCNI